MCDGYGWLLALPNVQMGRSRIVGTGSADVQMTAQGVGREIPSNKIPNSNVAQGRLREPQTGKGGDGVGWLLAVGVGCWLA